jgi:hypothetical protein
LRRGEPPTRAVAAVDDAIAAMSPARRNADVQLAARPLKREDLMAASVVRSSVTERAAVVRLEPRIVAPTALG